MSNVPSNEQIQTAVDNAYAYAKTVQGMAKTPPTSPLWRKSPQTCWRLP